MALPSVVANSPQAGYISWGAFNIQYLGQTYAIPAGNTNQRWVWWKYNTGGGTTFIDAGPDLPDTLTDDDLVILGNKAGIPIRVQSTTTIDGELIVDGSILGKHLAVETIKAANIEVGSLTALQMNIDSIAAAVVQTGILQAQFTITGVLSIAGTDAGWSAAEGLWIGDGVLLGAPGTNNLIDGDLVTSSLSVRDGLSIGGNADLHGTMALSNGVATPTAKMALGQTWPRITTGMGDGTGDNSNVFQGLYDLSGTQWVVAFNYFGAGFRKFDKATGAWAGDVAVNNWATNFYPGGGLAVIGTDWYVLGSDSTRNGDWYIYKIGSSGAGSKSAEFKVGNLSVFDSKRPRLVSNGTQVGMIWGQKSSGDLMLRWYDANLAAAVGSDVTLLAGTGTVNVGDAYYGIGQAGGVTRLWVSLQQGDSNMVRCFTTAGARVAAEDFPRAGNSTILGLSYDSAAANQRMVSYDATGIMWTYSKYTGGGTLSAQYTWYDGDNSVYPGAVGSGTTMINGVDKSGLASGLHETTPSPVSTYTLSKRAWPTIASAAAAPDELTTAATQVDKANRIGIYAAINGIPRLQSYLAVGVRNLPVTDALSTSGALAGSSGVQSFANASVPSPGRIKSIAGGATPIIDLNGSGDGRVGPTKWDSSGRPLCHGEYSSTSAANVAHQTWTARIGFGLRDATLSPSNGITYSNGVFTVSQRGLYVISGVLTFAAGGSGRRVCRLLKNGTTAIYQYEAPVGTGALSIVSLPFATVAILDAGETISPQGYQASGGTALAWDATDERNVFSIYCIAAMP